MGEAKRRRDEQTSAWPGAEAHRGMIDLHVLPSVPSINGARIRDLTGDHSIPEQISVVLRAFRAEAGTRRFLVGGCLGIGDRFSAIGLAVIERLTLEAPEAPIHIVPVEHEDIAWDIVLRHLRTFTGEVLLFAFPDSDVYDAGMAELGYSTHIRQFGPDGEQFARLSEAKLRARKAEILDRPPPPTFYPAGGAERTDARWIFLIATPVGKVIRTAVWDGRRDYAHELPDDIIRWVGGDKVAIVQVASPVGVNRRSSLDLTHRLAKDYDGVVHWAKDSETFQSILRSFIRLDLESIGPPDLSDDWEPEITFLMANE